MIWESQQSNSKNPENNENYTKHYVYEPQSFVPLLQTGYTGFIKLLETPDYAQFQHEDYSVYKDPLWKTETRKNKAELERVLFYHCDQVGTPQTLSNELGECIWEIKQDVWGNALEIKASHNLIEQTNIRFQGQYYDGETGLHYNRYRYYEPHSARYVSKDPIGLFGGTNMFCYPLNTNQFSDPLGLMEINTVYTNLGGGYDLAYKFHFDSSWIDVLNSGGKGIVKQVGKIATMTADYIQPDPIKFKGWVFDFPVCKMWDEKFETVYRNMYGNKERLTRSEAKKFLDKINKDYPNVLPKWYGYSNSETILDDLDRRAKEFKGNKQYQENSNAEKLFRSTEREMRERGL